MQQVQKYQKEIKGKIVEYLTSPSSTPAPPVCESNKSPNLECTMKVFGMNVPSIKTGEGANATCVNPTATANWTCK